MSFPNSPKPGILLYAGKVDRWHNSQHILRWTATGLLDIEPRLNKIQGARYLPLLKYKLREIVRERVEKHPSAETYELAAVT